MDTPQGWQKEKKKYTSKAVSPFRPKRWRRVAGQQNTIGGIVPYTRKVDGVELCESVYFGQVPVALLCPLKVTQVLRGSGALSQALFCAPVALNSQLRWWEVSGGPSQPRLTAPAGPDANPIATRQSVPAAKPRGAQNPGRDLLVASPEPPGRRRMAARCRGANFYTYFLFRFGFGVALAPPKIWRPGPWFPTARDFASPAPRSPPAFRRTKFSPSMLEVVPKGSTTSIATTMTTTKIIII